MRTIVVVRCTMVVLKSRLKRMLKDNWVFMLKIIYRDFIIFIEFTFISFEKKIESRF